VAKNEARHHHHIPQCYLRGFSTGSGKKCRVQVANLVPQVWFETNPRNIGGVRDFNRIELEGFEPDALEGMLSNFEGEVATAIRNIVASHKFDGADRNAVLNLIALLAVRSPQNREQLRKFEEEVLKKVLGLSLATKERWEAQEAEMKKAGYEMPNEIPYEQMKEFYESDEYTISLNTEHHIAMELQSHDVVLRTLADRKWKLYITNEDKGFFVTTDRPVVLTWNHPEEMPVMMRDSPGFGMTETDLIFPLTKELLLVGSFEGEDAVLEAPAEFVAFANMRMIRYSHGQVYAAKRSFPYIGPDRRFYNDRHFMEQWEPYRKKTVTNTLEGAAAESG